MLRSTTRMQSGTGSATRPGPCTSRGPMIPSSASRLRIRCLYSRHYSKCVSGRVPIEQLAKNVRTFVAARPDLQKKPVQVGLINYLIELFGAAPQLGRRFFGSACPRGDCRPPGNPRAADTLAGGLTSTSLKMG